VDKIPKWHPKKCLKRTIATGFAFIFLSFVPYLIKWLWNFNALLNEFTIALSAIIAGVGISILSAVYLNSQRDKQTTP